MPVSESSIARLYRTSPVERPKLRIGLLVDSPQFMTWYARIVEDIRASNFAELCVVVYNKSASVTTSSPTFLSLRALRLLKDKPTRQQLLYSQYTVWDAQWAPASENPLAVCDYSEVLKEIPALEVTPITHEFTHSFSPQVIASIRSYDLDVLLRFGFNMVRGDILRASRYGVWSFHHGDNEFYRGGPAHFWELVERHQTTGVMLQVVNNEELDPGLVLAKGVFATQQGMFLSRNRYGPYWGTTHFVIQKLYELHRYGWEFVRSKAIPQIPYHGKREVYGMPNNWQTLRWLSRECLAATRRVIGRQVRPGKKVSWHIGIRFSKTPLFEETARDIASFRWCAAPAGHTFADPMAFEYRGRRWIFIEDFDRSMNKAVISVAEIGSDGRIDVFTPCLTQPYHLSYPVVFAHEGDIFMIPETGTVDRVELYRAAQFPFEWKFEKVLVSLRAVDTTPLYYGGRWWFFTTITEPRGWGVFGFLFTADTLTDEWRLHPCNPITSSVMDARSAGPIIHWEGHLLRPTQSACPDYGSSVSFHEITQLDSDRFRQQRRTTIDPVGIPHVVGMHMFSRAGDLEAIDSRMVAGRY